MSTSRRRRRPTARPASQLLLEHADVRVRCEACGHVRWLTVGQVDALMRRHPTGAGACPACPVAA